MTAIEAIYKKNETIVHRQIGDEAILVPIRQQSGDLENVYTLNEVASQVWQLIDGKNTLQTIFDSIVNDYEVNRSEAEQDILLLMDQLEKIEAISK